MDKLSITPLERISQHLGMFLEGDDAIYAHLDMIGSYVRNEPMKTLAYLLNGIDPDSVDEDGWTLLHWAAMRNDPLLAEILYSLGADPNKADEKMNYTPLYVGAKKKSHHFVGVSLILDWPIEINKSGNTGPPLLAAVTNNDMRMVQILLDNGADPTTPGPMGIDIIEGADIAIGNSEMVELLKKYRDR